METDIEEMKQDIIKVQQQIDRVEQHIVDVEEELKTAATHDVARLRIKDERLWKDKEQLWKKEDQLWKKELLLLKRADKSGLKVDTSRSWSEVMLLKELPELPQDEMGLGDILFPNQNGRLPVTKEVYNFFKVSHSEIVDKLLFRADGSDLCAAVSHDLRKPFHVKSETDVLVFVGGTIKYLFGLLDSVSSHSFKNEVLFNQRENSRSSSSRTGSTGKRTSPDTLVIASDCTFLVGEDKALKLSNAEVDLTDKLRPLSPVFYGPVMFMLGYMAAATTFQWVYTRS